MLIVAATFTVHAAHCSAFRTAVLANAKASLQQEEGCLTFDVCERDGGATVFLYERYTDQAAFDAHLRSAHFLDFDAQTRAWVTDKRVETYHPA